MKWIAIIALLCVCIACKKKQEQTSPTIETITESVYASGFVKSKNQYQVYASVNGIIQKLLVEEGDAIKKGDPILLIKNETSQLNTDNARLAAQYASVNSNNEKLREAKINIDLAHDKMMTDSSLLQRQRNLWVQQIGTRNDVEQRELAYRNSYTVYNAAKLRYKDLVKQLEFAARQTQKNLQISSSLSRDYMVRSSTNGRVYSILKEEGEMVNTQMPVAIVGDATSFYLELQVDEYDIASIRVGQKVVLNMDSYKGQVFDAVIEKIDPIMNERSKSFTVEARFVQQPPALYPNLTTEANIIIRTKEKVLTIPRNYLIDDSYVLVSKKQKQKVITGLKDYQKVEIVSGLSEKDIILKPLQ